MRPGRRNLITDVAGLKVGNAADPALKSGVSVLTSDRPFIAAVHVMGGAPGTRETDLLAPDRLVQKVDALVLSGGSAFGLEAAGGVTQALRAQGRGFRVGAQRVPVVPAAILNDLENGGAQGWRDNPWHALGAKAMAAAKSEFGIGTAGAGTGATTHGLKGGLGSASAVLDSGYTVGALVAVNAVGSVVADDAGRFWAAPWEMQREFGGLGAAVELLPGREPVPLKSAGAATTIAVVATDAALDQAQATRLAVAAHDGMARAIVPSHTPFDGDLVFTAATGARPLVEPAIDAFALGHAAACCLARAIGRAVFEASTAPDDTLPCWQARYGSGRTA